jgi:AcrR family transcriptional regulator
VIRSKSTPRARLTAEQRRESILAAAVEVFAEQGYRRGRVPEIAARLGVSEPVVFQNFGTKAALFRAVLARAADTACATLATAVEQGASVSELLATVLSPAHVERFHEPGALGAVFADAASLTADPDVGEAARQAIQRIGAALADLLAHGQRAGDVRADLDPSAGAWWLMSLLSARAFRTASAPAPEAVEAELAAMTLRLIAT